MPSAEKRSLDDVAEEVRPISKRVKTADDGSADNEVTSKKERKEKKEKKRAKEERKKAKKEEKEERRRRKKEKKGRSSDGDSNGDSGPAVVESAPAAPEDALSYRQTAQLSAVPDEEIGEFFSAQQIAISDPSLPTGAAAPLRPILKFSHLPPSTLLSKSPFATFSAPTPIQAASWPFALSGRDVIGVAETGSGKTIAFALPCIESLYASARPAKQEKNGRVAYARAVVVSPTRELAMQTHVAMAELAKLVGLSAVCLYGGASKDEQRALLHRNRGADIIVATPGRLKDFLSEGAVSLSQARFVVLDEADRMLDKGFEDDIKLILGSCPAREERQTLMFTATWPASVRGLAESFMVRPVKITIGHKTRAGDGADGSGDGADGVIELQANSRISQTVEVVEPHGKEYRLAQLLRDAQQGKGKKDRILVFCLYKKEAVRVEQFLQRKGVSVASIHGDLRQEQRTRSLEAFKAGTTTVLVATDVAARGLDIPEVKLVINVTFPLTIEDYVHRIGRTGRAGKEGKAITLFTEHDKAHSGSLINVLKAANQPVPEDLLKFGTTVKRKAHDTYGAFFKDVDMNKKGTKITFD